MKDNTDYSDFEMIDNADNDDAEFSTRNKKFARWADYEKTFMRVVTSLFHDSDPHRLSNSSRFTEATNMCIFSQNKRTRTQIAKFITRYLDDVSTSLDDGWAPPDFAFLNGTHGKNLYFTQVRDNGDVLFVSLSSIQPYVTVQLGNSYKNDLANTYSSNILADRQAFAKLVC